KIVGAVDKIVSRRSDIKVHVDRWAVGITAADTLKFMVKDEFDGNYKKKLGSSPAAGSVFRQVVDCANEATLLAFTNIGNCYKIDLSERDPVDWRAPGLKLTDICTEAAKNERVVKLFAFNKKKDGEVIMFTKQGAVKRTLWSEFENLKKPVPAIKLKDGDELLWVENYDADEFSTMLFVTKKAMCLSAAKDDVPVQGRVAGGVKGISLNAGDEVIFATQQNGEGEIVVVTSLGGFKRVISSLFETYNRASKGVMIADIKGKGELVFANYVTIPYKLAVSYGEKSFKEVDTEDISIESRVFKGKPIDGVSDIKRVIAMRYKTDYAGGAMQIKFD
ncbi:MAG: hypothetical protein K2K80_02125, partial [Clostridia bacterium]|nr:hypothetical protein [Clostridia bacterium]